MTLKTKAFDPAAYLDSATARQAYLDEALATGDSAFIADALGVVARAKGMTAVAKSANVSRESLYKSLNSNGNPEFGTVLKVFDALGLRLSVTAHGTKTRHVAARKTIAKKALPAAAAKRVTRRPNAPTKARAAKHPAL